MRYEWLSHSLQITVFPLFYLPQGAGLTRFFPGDTKIYKKN